MQHKICSTCKLMLDLGSFAQRKASPDGLAYVCRGCQKIKVREHYLAHSNTYKERASSWRESNPESRKAVLSRYRSSPAGRDSARKRVHTLRAAGEWPNDYVAIISKDPCVWCGGKSNSIDHIAPVSKGGTNHWTNLAPACRSCNSSKGARSLLTHLMLGGFKQLPTVDTLEVV